MYFNWKRMLISLLIIIGVEYGASYLLLLVEMPFILYVLIISLVSAFTIALVNYPWEFRRDFMRDPAFHKSFAIMFAILLVLNLFL